MAVFPYNPFEVVYSKFFTVSFSPVEEPAAATVAEENASVTTMHSHLVEAVW